MCVWLLETEFLCVALAVLELTLKTRLAIHSVSWWGFWSRSPGSDAAVVCRFKLSLNCSNYQEDSEAKGWGKNLLAQVE